MTAPWPPMQRVLTSLAQKEPDRVPFFLLFSLHGAKQLGVPIREYFSSAENVVEGQLRLREQFRHDCLYTFHYAAIEVEAAGSEVVFITDGPPNAGPPILSTAEAIRRFEPPAVRESPQLLRVLEATRRLKVQVGDSVPIIGVVMSPFSLPVMQLGFDRYLDLIFGEPALFEVLMRANEGFCVEWANAQLEAGATAICYFDPVSSPTVVPPGVYRRTGWQVARRTLARIKGPTATHFASGRSAAILDDVADTGTAVVGVSADEDLSEIKAACRGRMSVLGNLNSVEMRRLTPESAEAAVKQAIRKAAPGGGFILSENHGEIPMQVPDGVLRAIADAVERWGRYPIEWCDDEAVS